MRRNKVSGNVARLIALSSAFLVIPFTILVSNEDAKELRKDQKQTMGIVNKSWVRKDRRKGGVWSVQVFYYVEGVRYQTASKDDRDETLMYGDTVTVVYSSKTPENSEIKELLDYYSH